jgi:hypothetical protein
MADVVELSDHVEVRNRSLDEVQQALRLLDAARRVQRDQAREFSQQLLHAMVAADLETIPAATLAQAQRLAAKRSALLEHGAYTQASLAQLRGARESSLRTWVTRTRHAHRLFTVKESGRTLIPAVQLTDAGELRADLSPLLEVLLPAGVDGWELWAWLLSATSLLSGAAPADVVVTDPSRAVRAAQRLAATVSQQRPLAGDPSAAPVAG